MSDKWWNLEEGLAQGYGCMPHTMLVLYMNSEALTKSEINVLACLFRQTVGINGRPAVRASAEQIASVTKLHPKSVEVALRALERAGHITIERAKGSASLFRLTFETIVRPAQERKQSRRNSPASPPPARYKTDEAPKAAHRNGLRALLGEAEESEQQRRIKEARRKRMEDMLGPD